MSDDAFHDWAYALHQHDRGHTPPPTPARPSRHVVEVAEGEVVATLIMGLYHSWCSECGGVDVNGGEELYCTNCGAAFHFIRPSRHERFLPEDYEIIRSIAQATGLQING